MENANITDIKLISYPSTHILGDGPKILLVGEHEENRNKFIHSLIDIWTDVPLSFYFIDEEYNEENISWLYMVSKISDFIICFPTKNNITLSITSFFAQKENSFIISNKEDCNLLHSWLSYININKVTSDINSVQLKMKFNWIKGKL